MTESAITQYIINTFPGVEADVASKESGAPEVAWGDTFFFHDSQHRLDPKHHFPFATIVTKDYGDFDCASNLNRPGIFRLNIGITKTTFATLFDPAATHDFTALDKIMPHPVYGKMFWVCVLNPGAEAFEKVKKLLAEAFEQSAGRQTKR